MRDDELNKHGMIPGSHERIDGAECRCGASWNMWAGDEGKCSLSLGKAEQ